MGQLKPKPVGRKGVAGSDKVTDTCGVCGGNNGVPITSRAAAGARFRDYAIAASRTAGAGVWQQLGDVTRDANCFNTGNANQPLMRTQHY